MMKLTSSAHVLNVLGIIGKLGLGSICDSKPMAISGCPRGTNVEKVTLRDCLSN